LLFSGNYVLFLRLVNSSAKPLSNKTERLMAFSGGSLR
jgi:hypothetical protein